MNHVIIVDGESVVYPQFVQGLFAKRHKDEAGLLHAAVGVAGECGELLDALKKTWVYNKPLDRENVVEELGDIGFYAIALINTVYERPTNVHVDIDAEACAQAAARDGGPICRVSDLVTAAGQLLDCAVSIFERDLRPELAVIGAQGIDTAMQDVIGSLAVVHEVLGVSFEEAQIANVRKLRKRYPNGYTDQAAHERADKA